jgi:DNA-binding response OmpR family regulator
MTQNVLKGMRILIVEDEPLLAWELELALADAGATVVGPARTLSIGCALAQQEDLAAAILDMRLGEEDSSPIAAALYEQGVPFVFHTGHGTRQEFAAQWSAPVITKPSHPEAVVAKVAWLVALTAKFGRGQDAVR